MSNEIAHAIEDGKKSIIFEWVWDESIELPHIEKVLSGHLREKERDALLCKTIMILPGIKEIESIKSYVNKDERRLYIQFKANLHSETHIKYKKPEVEENPELIGKELGNFEWYKHLMEKNNT